MADPITGMETDPDVVSALDYLGRRSPVFSTGQSALPSVGGPTPSAGPSGPGGAGVTPGSPDPTNGGALGQSTPGTVATNPGGPDSSATILNAIGQGIGGAKSATQAARQILGSDTPQESIQAPEGIFKGVQPSGPADVEIPGAGFSSESIQAPAGIFQGVQPSGGFDTEGGGVDVGGILGAAGAGLSGVSLAALIAKLAESGQISPGQLVGLLQSSGGTASSLASQLGPEGATALAGSLGPEAASLLSAAGGIVGGAGAAASVGLSLKNEFDALRAGRDDPRQYASAGGSELGLAAGAILGTIVSPGYGTLIGAGAGGALGTYIGQTIARNLPPTHYMALRQHWGEVAADAVNSYGWGIQKAAAESGDLPSIQAAMSQRYADGHVSAYLSLPEYLATAIGVPAQTSFDSLNPQQFMMVLKAVSQTDPADYQTWVAGQGDVQYLEQGRAQQVSDATRGTAVATLKTLAQYYQPILAQMPDVAGDQISAEREWMRTAPERQAAVITQGLGASTGGDQ